MTDICTNNHGGNTMSVEANKATNKAKAMRMVLAALFVLGDATCDEVEQITGMSHQTCSARFSELKAAGLIQPTTRRKTRTGATAQAWRRCE